MTNGQPRDTGNIGHIRRRTNGQPRDTGNIGHTGRMDNPETLATLDT
jgi:hypothetical protein